MVDGHDGPRDLVDPFDRTVRDLRISVTDRCNFRCQYCMPAEGMAWLDRSEILTFEEITRLARIAVERFGFESIRITGGEPTVRAGLPELIAMLAELGVDISMTTNGSTMPLLAERLARAGLGRVNISLDSLRPERFRELTRRDDLAKVLEGIDAAIDAGFDPVKVNAVLMRGINDDEVLDFVELGRRLGVVVRFIEFMPLDAQGEWSPDRVVPADEIVETIESAHGLVPMRRGSEPAERFGFADGSGEVGVIASVTRPFCGDCDRVRLTAEGQFRTCLFSHDEFDLRALLRGGADDDAIAAELERAVGTKWAGHAIGQVNFLPPRRGMSQIGG